MDISKKPRYIRKPLLRLLECYVLHIIGKLNTEDARLLHNITPKLREIYGIDDSWKVIIETVMGLPTTFPDQVREIWDRNCELAAKNGEILIPQDFAEMFVDTNLINP